ncbi:TonB-dependent receptor [Parabacteroides sp.]
MKINYQKSIHSLLKLRKLLIFMLLSLFTINTGWAQDQRISITAKNKTLLMVFEEIEKQTGLSIAYNQTKLNINKKADKNFDNKSLSSIFTDLLQDSGFSFRFEDKHIIIVPIEQQKKQSSSNTPKKITGTIVDGNGMPIIGANVIVEGTSSGTITDLDGRFSLDVPAGSKLQVSYIGYLSKTITINNNTTYNIQLTEDTQALDEVVVVGYGTEKKVNVIGSIAQVSSEKLANRPTPMLSNALTGQMAGVTVIQRSGRPGNSGGQIRIRGVASFSNDASNTSKADALVLIDGIPGDLNDINTEDVESISVLKDASTAAIYGARAANGVILVTTKTGKEGKISISYNGYVGMNKATALPKFVNSWEYASLLNEADGKEYYTQAEIQKFRDGSDPDNYANANYLDEVFSRNGIQTGHDLTLNGGTSSNRYMLSFGYLHQDGLIRKNNYERYNTRLNLITDILSNLTITTRLSGTYATRNEPTGSMLEIVSGAVRTPGLWPTFLSNGELGLGGKSGGTPSSGLYSKSFFEEPDFKVNAQIRLDYSPIKDLKLSAIGGFNYKNLEQRTYNATRQLAGQTIGPSTLKHEMRKTIYKTFQATADYSKQIDKHNLGVLVGYSWEEQAYRTLIGERDKFPGNDLPYLNAGSPDNQKSSGGGDDWAIQSIFGRLRYNFDERYLLESTIRYDGSSRFPKDNKYGFFPSVAAGWRISEESFFKENDGLDWINNLKLKASWGILGNQNIGNYPYQTVFELGENYPFGDNYALGAAVTTATDPTIKWEETQTVDAGFESVFWNGQLSFNASYFYRNTYDILYKPSGSISSVLGQKISEMNTGKLKNTGWEFEIGHRNQVGEVSYNINGNFSIINNKIKSLGVGNVEQLNGMVGNGSDLFINYPIEMYYGYKTDGVFMNDKEVAEWADQTKVNPNSQAGDIRFKDISGPDGKPDGVVDPNYDRVYLGSRIPKYTFGLNLGAEYKGFDIQIQLQGVAGVKGLLSGFSGWALCGEGNIQRWQADGRFDPANPQRYPEYPRLQSVRNVQEQNMEVSDFWLLDASYLRLKTVQIGYTLPGSILKKAGISRLRLYVTAENPCTWNKYREGWDPEINTEGNYYPILATYTFGINLKF